MAFFSPVVDAGMAEIMEGKIFNLLVFCNKFGFLSKKQKHQNVNPINKIVHGFASPLLLIEGYFFLKKLITHVNLFFFHTSYIYG